MDCTLPFGCGCARAAPETRELIHGVKVGGLHVGPSPFTTSPHPSF